MTVTRTYTQEELDEFLSVPVAQEEPAEIVAIHEAQAQEEAAALEEVVAVALVQAARPQLQVGAGKGDSKTHYCEKCYKYFSRKADMDRHFNSVHLKIKAYVCPLFKSVKGADGKEELEPCEKAYAQKTSLKVHMLTHETDLLKQKPYLCCKSLKTGLCCMRRFGDPSSLSRHSREQHKGATYQCPFPGCLDRAKNPKRIKRQSEFKKHLVDKHNLTMEELALFQVFETDNIDEPAAGPSKPRKTTRKARRQRVRLPSPPPMYREAVSPAAHSSESPAPPSYSAVPYAGEIPTICTSNEDGYASTPGLTFCSPSPAPSIGEAAYDIHSKPAIPPPYYPSFESCPDFGAQPYPQPYPQDKDMSTYVAEASAGMGLLLPDSDLNNMSYASGLNHISVDSLSNMPQLFDQNSFMSDKPGPAQPPYADTTNSYYSGAPFDIAYQLSEYEYSGEYSSEYDQWAMPVPELAAPYVDQTNATIPPPFLHYGSSPFDVYNTQ